jgi:hypothetical protein
MHSPIYSFTIYQFSTIAFLGWRSSIIMAQRKMSTWTLGAIMVLVPSQYNLAAAEQGGPGC